MCRAFGKDVFDIIEAAPERLREVTGIGPKRAEKIISGWADQKVIREIMVFLHSHGVGTARAVRIFKTYGNDAVQVMAENPYRLARDIEIVVYDERGAGNGWLLPAGPLREPVNTPASPGLACPPLVMYNAPRASTELPGHLSASTLAAPVSLSAWWGREPATTPPAAGEVEPAQCWAMAGVAHPERFFSALRAQGWRFTPCPLADHADLDGDLPWPAGLPHLLVTEKDAVKLLPERCALERPSTRIWVVGLDFQPAATFWTALDAGLGRLRSQR